MADSGKVAGRLRGMLAQRKRAEDPVVDPVAERLRRSPASSRATASDIARYNVGTADELPMPKARTFSPQAPFTAGDAVRSDRHFLRDRLSTRAKVLLSAIILVELAFLSCGIMGAAGQYYPYSGAYATYDPAQVATVLIERAYNFLGEATHQWAAHDNAWLQENVPGYWAVWNRLGVVGTTLVCAVLLSVSGMLYQNVFRNPIASPTMLGATSGVSLGVMLLVFFNGAAAAGMLAQRYLYCYGLGALMLVFVIVAGRKLSGKGRPFDVVTMLLVGSIASQLLGFVVSYVTLFVMDEDVYLVYYSITQMLTVDTSLTSWAVLGTAAVCSLAPIVLLRFKLNALSFDEEEVRMMGLNATALRAVALVCGAVMILAAQIHLGMVGLVSLIVPFLARGWFGCGFGKQLAGNVCIGAILLLVCRDLTDLIPFVGDGLAIGSVVSVVALPLFVVVVARHMRRWE